MIDKILIDKILIDRSVIEQALEALGMMSTPSPLVFLPDEIQSWQNANEALRAALEHPQVEQEPVAWMFQHDETGRIMYVDAQQVEWGFEQNNPRLIKIRPVYLHPQQPRQPLTDEAEHQCPYPKANPSTRNAWLDGWEAAERAHGIGDTDD